METAYYEDFIKFAKRHYGDWDNQEDMIQKLKIVNGYWSGVDVKYIDTYSLLENLLLILKKHVNYNQYENIIWKMFEREYNYDHIPSRKIKTLEDKIEYLLIEISLLPIKNDKEILIMLGENDPELEKILYNSNQPISAQKN